MKIAIKKELGFTIGIEKDLLYLHILQLDIMVNTIKKQYKNKIRYILDRHYDFLSGF